MTSAPQLPDLFQNYQMQQEKSTESSFEQLCSLRANDHGSGPVILSFPSSTVNDETEEGQDEF